MITGIIGLPNAGKSALFNLLTGNSVPSSAYPYCTVEPNEGIAEFKDSRINDLKKVLPGAEAVCPAIKFVDVAGLPPGASKGEGLGNKFLSHIREADVLVHTVRAFKDEKVSTFDGSQPDPQSDLELVNTELFLADLEIVQRRLKENPGSEYYRNAREKLEKQIPPPQDEEKVLLTPLPQIVLVNITSGSLLPKVDAPRVIYMDVGYQAELTGMSPEERKEFINEVPSGEATIDDILIEVKKLLSLVTFFTIVGGEKIKGYNVPAGTSVKKAAGKIHTDMEKGFIRANVYSHTELKDCSFSLEELKKKGKLRTEGKDYPVNDGDIVEILFS